ncbi:MAG: hypothetical protein LUO89_14390, partial [Methanothrix sp.]|nr:hypothetical protein [Methanothrix sp.]
QPLRDRILWALETLHRKADRRLFRGAARIEAMLHCKKKADEPVFYSSAIPKKIIPSRLK